jgi:hypothetical protein
MMGLAFALSCLGIAVTLWGAVELAIEAERDRRIWEWHSSISVGRKWLKNVVMVIK